MSIFPLHNNCIFVCDSKFIGNKIIWFISNHDGNDHLYDLFLFHKEDA